MSPGQVDFSTLVSSDTYCDGPCPPAPAADPPAVGCGWAWVFFFLFLLSLTRCGGVAVDTEEASSEPDIAATPAPDAGAPEPCVDGPHVRCKRQH